MTTKSTTIDKLAKKKRTLSPTPQPEWQNPRVPQPLEAIANARTLTVLELAQNVAGLGAAPEVLAAVIIAQAADRLGAKMIEAAAVGRYRGA
jgi:hypothetical protein